VVVEPMSKLDETTVGATVLLVVLIDTFWSGPAGRSVRPSCWHAARAST